MKTGLKKWTVRWLKDNGEVGGKVEVIEGTDKNDALGRAGINHRHVHLIDVLEEGDTTQK